MCKFIVLVVFLLGCCGSSLVLSALQDQVLREILTNRAKADVLIKNIQISARLPAAAPASRSQIVGLPNLFGTFLADYH